MATGLLALGAQSPNQQQQNDYQKGLLGLGQQQLGQLKQPFNYANAPAMPGDYSALRNAATKKVGDYFTGRLDQQYKSRDQDFAQSMANQGLDAGSDAYKRNYQLYNDQKNRAYQDANLQAFNTGSVEQQAAFNQAMQQRQQGISEANSIRSQGLNEFGATAGQIGQMAGVEQSASQFGQGLANQNEQNAATRAHETALQQGQFGQQTAIQKMQQDFLGGQNAIDRAQQTSERLGAQDYQSGQNQAERDLQEKLQAAGFSHDEALQIMAQQFQHGENDLGRIANRDIAKMSADASKYGADKSAEASAYGADANARVATNNNQLINQLIGLLGVGSGGSGSGGGSGGSGSGSGGGSGSGRQFTDSNGIQYGEGYDLGNGSIPNIPAGVDLKAVRNRNNTGYILMPKSFTNWYDWDRQSGSGSGNTTPKPGDNNTGGNDPDSYLGAPRRADPTKNEFEAGGYIYDSNGKKIGRVG